MSEISEINKIPNSAMQFVPIPIKPEINMTTNFFLSLALKVLTPLLSLVTQPIKDELTSFVKNLYIKAKNTESPIDDLFVEMLAKILSIELG